MIYYHIPFPIFFPLILWSHRKIMIMKSQKNHDYDVTEIEVVIYNALLKLRQRFNYFSHHSFWCHFLVHKWLKCCFWWVVANSGSKLRRGLSPLGQNCVMALFDFKLLGNALEVDMSPLRDTTYISLILDSNNFNRNLMTKTLKLIVVYLLLFALVCNI